MTGDVVLRQTMAGAISKHLDNFYQPKIPEAPFPHELTRHVIQAMKLEYEWLQPQLIVMQECLVSADTEVAEMKAGKKAMQNRLEAMTATVEQGHKLLHDTSKCRHCGMLFLDILETNTANGLSYIVCCKDCRTKRSQVVGPGKR
ncbi:uncharacterized protein BO80DRAFT_476784, partial [Aspergillus ibericus CBS 121593]